jgi:hypothetical protein
MTQESETALFNRLEEMRNKQDKILLCLTGQPLSTPPVPGLVQISQDNTKAIADQAKKIESLEGWRSKVKIRFAQIGGGVIVAGFAINRCWEAFVAWLSAKHD